MTAPSLEAVSGLFPDARVARDADLVAFWEAVDRQQLTTTQVAKRFNVSRQAVFGWRRRAGLEAKPRTRKASPELLLAELRSGSTVERVAARHGLHAATVRRAAKAAGLSVPRAAGRQRLSSEALVALATGKTWREFAEAAALSICTLRNRVYGDAELSKRVRAVMVGTTKRGF